MNMQRTEAWLPSPSAVSAPALGRSRMRARPMLYDAFEVQVDLAEQTRAWGRILHDAAPPGTQAGSGEPVTWWSAGARMMMRAGLTFTRPTYGIDSVSVGNRDVPVIEEGVYATPFGTLLRSKKDIDTEQPRVLVVAPLSGHFATLLRGTIRTLLPDHDVYVTD